MSAWKKLRIAVDIPFLLIGAALTIYIGFAAFGFVKNSSEHYSNFILGICLMTGLWRSATFAMSNWAART